MNRLEIINKIREIFGMVKNNFSLYRTKEGVELRVDELTMDMEVYVITPEGELPAPDGDVVLEDGTKVKIAGGVIKEMEIVEEEVVEEEVVETEEETMEEHEEEKMAEATLVDGTIVDTDGELVVGAELYVKTEEGRQPAPDDEHETTDGMVIVVKDGIIVEIKEKEDVEEDEVKVEEVMETFMDALEALNNQVLELRKENEELTKKFSKFQAEPAGEKIYDRKGAYVEQLMSSQVDKLERLSALRRAIK